MQLQCMRGTASPVRDIAAHVGGSAARDPVHPETGDDGRALYSYGGEPVHYDGLPDTIDVVAMQNGYATVTPLHRDLTDYRMLNEMKKWRTNK